jgi:two-component system, OmpR family, phosphate regulon sensor histidine kinase PhoR
MFLRRSLSLPILLAVGMIVVLVVLAVGWVLLSVFGAVKDKSSSGLYWAMLSVGATFIALLLVGVVLYLILSIKAINLTRRQSNFIDSVTHELKSPIASMKLYLQTLTRHQVSQQVQTDFYRFMLEDLARLDHLINQMLDAGLLDAERPKGENEDVDLAELLRDCAAAVSMNYRVAADTVRLDLQPGTVVGRRIDLDIIFRNLIDNAV